MIKEVAVEDLWPGDHIIARRPGGYTGMPCRVSHTEESSAGRARVRLVSGLGTEFDVFADWKEPVELVG
jgi:hypothetical protein